MEGAAQTLLSNAGQLLAADYQQLSGVGGQVAELCDDLATMNALLRMQSEAEDGAVDHFVREWMKQLRELAYDTEDCVDLYKLRIKCRPRGDVRLWLKHLLETLFPRRRLAGEISALRARAVAIGERHARYGVSRDALRPGPAAPSSLLAASASAHALRADSNNGPQHHHIVGIEDQVDALAEKLVTKKAGADDDLKVFSIVGFGGLGKTTLAMEVCRRLEAEFPCQAMVAVSQAFQPGRDVMELLKRVLKQVVESKQGDQNGIKREDDLGGGIHDLDHKGLVDKLREVLKDKRYLIVIDDVWSIRAWEAIQSVLPESKCDGRIILTTRIETVAEACSPAADRGHYIHHMEVLKEEDSKKLFLSRAFGSLSASCPKELEDVMCKILKRCSGLPLAIVSIASVLAGYTSPGSKDKWETICNSIGSQMESNPTLEGMKHIITLSFSHLPHELKGCMMYLSIFPEDYEINRERLLDRWIAEGLVLEKRGLTLMKVAESYLDELLSRNMIAPHSFHSSGRMKSCRVHDMLLEVMVSKSLESNFVSLLGGPYAGMSYSRIRRLSIQRDDGSSYGTEQGQTNSLSKKNISGHGSTEAIDVQHVRSLSMFQLNEHMLLDELYKFTLLRVLDLEDCKGLTNKHVKYICRLYLLRFLSLKDTNISKVPSQVKKLEHLQVLNVIGTRLGEVIEDRRNRGLSDNVTNLMKLERLLFSGRDDMHHKWILPSGIGKMKALREVGIAELKNDVKTAQGLGELEQLEDLWICIDTDNNDKVLEEFVKSLGKMYSLRRLFLSDNGWSDKMKFLHELPTPPRHLRHIRIGGNVGPSLPDWVGSLTYLVEFCMSWAFLRDDKLFGVLCKLPSLKSINVEEKCYIDHALVSRTIHNFRALVSLDVSARFTDDPKVFQFEEESMPKLERIVMDFRYYDNTTTRTFVGLEHLTSLKEVRLMGKKSNTAIDGVLEQLIAANNERPIGSKEFKIVVKYT